MRKIIIEFIPHSEQRYETPGDWYFDSEENLRITVSQISEYVPRQSEFLIAIHELTEALLCLSEGITSQQIDNWDMREVWRDRGFSEPGEDPMAPYHRQHILAEIIERQVAHFLFISWKDYSETVDSLQQSRAP